MHATNPKVKKLLEQYKQISTLGKVDGVLGWDTNVNLPPKASEGRATQSALVTEIITDQWLEPKFRQLFEEVKEEPKLSEEEKAVVRNLEKASRFYYKVPKEVIIEFSKTTSEAFMAWQAAKKDNKFKDYLPHLKKVVSLSQLIAKHLGYSKNPYDALLDLYEPDLTASECGDVFKKLQPPLTKLVNKIKASKNYSEENELVNGTLNYPKDDQKQLALFVLRRMHYDLDAGRLDESAHPFTTEIGGFDTRITTWYHENNFTESLMAAMHEGGHALYEQGIKEEFADTPLEGGVSLGIHESQSRFWENQVGRSKEFLEFMTPIFQAFYPTELGHVGSESIVKLFNQVKPSLIRVLADEVTYNLHIILRFDLENDLINNKLKVENLPQAWNEKMKKYLGVTPKTDREGVLQDVHWSYGSIGYFPTYTLGNLYSAQFTASMKKELDLKSLISKAEFGTILSWLRTNIHQYGGLYYPKDLVKKVTKEELNPQYFIDYIYDKYKDIYDLKI